jgi:tetratricopeptide (TPR) repeat protein
VFLRCLRDARKRAGVTQVQLAETLGVGEAIERRHGHEVDLRLDMLAHHFSRAAGQEAKARDYARRAGDRAMSTSAFEDAAMQYGRALATLEDADPDGALRCELLIRRGGAQARAGAYQAGKETLLVAVESARRRGDHERLARAALGFGEPQVEGGLVDRQLVALLQEALGMLGTDNRGLRVRLLARLSLELAFADDTELQQSSSREALQTARQLDDAEALTSALRARWMAVWGPDGLDERLDLEREMLRVAAQADNLELEIVGRARRITSCLQAGQIRAVETEIAEHARLAGHIRMPFHVWTGATLRAMQAHLHGSLAEAEQLADEALGMDPTRPNVRFSYLDLMTPIRWEQGRLGELREPWRQAVEEFPLFGYARGWLCLADAETGHVDAAEGGLRSLVEQLLELPRNGLWLPAVAVASLAAFRLDAPHAAASIYPLLQPYRGQFILIPTPHPVVCLGSAALYLALLAASLLRE